MKWLSKKKAKTRGEKLEKVEARDGVIQRWESECQRLVMELGEDPQSLRRWHGPTDTLALDF